MALVTHIEGVPRPGHRWSILTARFGRRRPRDSMYGRHRIGASTIDTLPSKAAVTAMAANVKCRGDGGGGRHDHCAGAAPRAAAAAPAGEVGTARGRRR